MRCAPDARRAAGETRPVVWHRIVYRTPCCMPTLCLTELIGLCTVRTCRSVLPDRRQKGLAGAAALRGMHACCIRARTAVSFSSRVRRLRHGRPDSTGEQRCLSVVRHTDHPCVMCPDDTRHGLTRPPSYEMSASLLTSSLQASDNGASCAFFFCIETVVGPVHWITSDGSMAPFSEKKLFFFVRVRVCSEVYVPVTYVRSPVVGVRSWPSYLNFCYLSVI